MIIYKQAKKVEEDVTTLDDIREGLLSVIRFEFECGSRVLMTAYFGGLKNMGKINDYAVGAIDCKNGTIEISFQPVASLPWIDFDINYPPTQ